MVKRFIFASDLHGDKCDPVAVEKLLEFVKIWKPQVKVFGGDLFDFRNIRKNAGIAERQESMQADVEQGLEFLSRYQPDIFLMGNHDKRLWDVARFHENGIVSDYAKQGVKDIESRCRKIKCKLIEYKSDSGFYDLGKVRMIHGYCAGIMATKKHAEIYSPQGGIVLHGHTHAIHHHTIQRVGGGEGRGVGCLAQLDMDYNVAQPNRITHKHGFAYGWTSGNDWEVYQARKGKGDKWQVVGKVITI
jgi:predicted MPP superfamily phosphohydrolase